MVVVEYNGKVAAVVCGGGGGGGGGGGILGRCNHFFIAHIHGRQDVSSNVGQLQVTDSNTCGHYALFFLFARARGKSMESFIQPFKYLRDVENDHKIGETLKKTPNTFSQIRSGRKPAKCFKEC